jgi:transglutaminase-like putative cysteine protease
MIREEMAMKTTSIFIALVLAISVSTLSWGADLVPVKEVYESWVNPAYRNLFPETLPLSKTPRDNGTPTICNSYDEFKAALKTNLENRVTSFSLRLIYSFNFSEIMNISNQAFNEIQGADDYLSYNIVTRTTNGSGFEGDVTLTYTMKYWTTLEQEQLVSQRVTDILAQIITSAMSDEEKNKKIHDWVVLNVQYDTAQNDIQHSAYAALFLGKAVCQGYALLMFKMLKQVGINNRIILGRGNGNGSWQDHTWNLVYLCGNWYHVDATFDDPIPDEAGRIFYTYFNKSDAEMSADHTWQAGTYPSAPNSYVQGKCCILSSTNLSDVIVILQIVSGISPNSAICSEADKNGDGKISLEETIYILHVLAGLR